MKKPLLIILTLLLSSSALFAQDFVFGEVTPDEMSMKRYDKDTSAHAVVLNEHGRAEISATNDDHLRLVYEYHEKIKIFDKAAFDQGNIEIPFYSEDGQTYEEVDAIKAVTTFTDESGNISTIELDPKKIYTTKDSKHWGSVKFALPGLRNGCVIEFKYRKISPYWENFHPWEFQSNIPKIYSEYDTHIPGFWNFNASLVGPLKLTKQKAELESECFSYYGAKADCSHLTFAMSDIPAFIVEDYMTSPRNFLSAINFELSDEVNMQGGGKIKIAKEWKDVDYELKHNEYFGDQLKKESLFKDKVAAVIAGKTDELDKAKAIYAYVKTIIKWNEDDDDGSADGLRKAVASHTGNAAEVNFSLFGALKSAGLNPEAVLLSTREHGVVNKLYPIITGFNYVVVKLDIGGKSYLLDATDPMLPFGMLPLRCLNDQGRVMSLDKPSYWIDMNTPQKEDDVYQLDLTLLNDGNMKGTITHYYMGYAAYKQRKEIRKFNSTDEYIESLNEKSNRLKIVGSEIANLDSLDLPLSEKFTIEIKDRPLTDNSRFGFNPIIEDRLTINPFKLADRTYPVDWGMPSSTRYTVTMHLPNNYSVESDPHPAGFTLPDNGGNFLTTYLADDNSFTFSYLMKFNKSIYSPAEYPYLKEFYNKMILAEKSEIMLKKKI